MTDDPFERVRPPEDKAGPAGPPRGKPDPGRLPPGFPVTPLGAADGIYRFLSARGEIVAYGAAALAMRAHLVSLFAGAARAEAWLAWLGKPKRSEAVFSPAGVADFLMAACACKPLYDDSVHLRRRGTWRGAGAEPVVHLGDRLLGPGQSERPAGHHADGAVYAACPAGAAPVLEGCPADDLAGLRDEIAALWSWARPVDADIFCGWLGMASLGQYPAWRAHLYLTGQPGWGKSTLVRIASSMLGGMSSGVRKAASEAAVRQATNAMAIARIFDEAEKEGESGHVESVIGLFRLMSDADGAMVERGSVAGAASVWRLYGAGFFAAINAAGLRPADRSRFVTLELVGRPAAGEPLAAAARLGRLEGDAAFYGPRLWGRMLAEAPGRWDAAHRRYAALVQQLGGDRRAGDTIGVVLAGWDLALHDGEPDEPRLRRAEAMAQALLDDVRAAEVESDGERCLRLLLAAYIPREHGGTVTVGELVERLQDDADLSAGDQRLLGRLSMRIMDGPRGRRELFVANGSHPHLDRALAATPWRGGGHRAALLTLDGVRPAPNPVRLSGAKARGLLVSFEQLPGGDMCGDAQKNGG